MKTYELADGKTLEIFQDECTESPRDWSNLGTMVCFHGRYDLGDDQKEHGLKQEDFCGWEEIKEWLKRKCDAAIILPLYLYDHSGITMSTTPFSCPWDSGQVGFIFVTNARIKAEYGDLSPESMEKAKKCLQAEVKVYNQYIRGDVYGFILRDVPCEKCGGEGEAIDSCGGFYGDDIFDNGIIEQLSHHEDVVEELKMKYSA